MVLLLYAVQFHSTKDIDSVRWIKINMKMSIYYINNRNDTTLPTPFQFLM